jgi:hypothetical protein
MGFKLSIHMDELLHCLTNTISYDFPMISNKSLCFPDHFPYHFHKSWIQVEKTATGPSSLSGSRKLSLLELGSMAPCPPGNAKRAPGIYPLVNKQKAIENDHL